MRQSELDYLHQTNSENQIDKTAVDHPVYNIMLSHW